jgi:hypothetical protein
MEHPLVINSQGKLENKNAIGPMQGIIAKYLKSPAGKQRLAASMIQPLKTRLDYQSIARKCFAVDPLPTGAAPTYDKDPNVAGILNPGRVVMPEFEIYANPTIRLSEVRKRRFDLIDRYGEQRKYKKIVIW